MRVLGWLLPQPDLVIVLEAPPDVLMARKSEIEPVELERQTRAWRSLSLRHARAGVSRRRPPGGRGSGNGSRGGVLAAHRAGIRETRARAGWRFRPRPLRGGCSRVDQERPRVRVSPSISRSRSRQAGVGGWKKPRDDGSLPAPAEGRGPSRRGPRAGRPVHAQRRRRYR